MNDERSEQASPANQVEGAAQCRPGCACGSTGLGTKGKVIICLVVAIAATVVLARAHLREAENKPAQGQEAYTATLPATAQTPTPPTAGKTQETETSQTTFPPWGEPLKSLASLNQVAADTDAVFVYLTAKGQGPNQRTQKEIEAAAGKARSGGTLVAFYALSEDCSDYKQVLGQVPAPCVLAMVKGRGMTVVFGEITEGRLLQGLVAASRPSSCGPSGCGPSGCP